VGRHQGRPVFVSATAPGDLVEVALLERGRRFEGRLLRVVEPGEARVDTVCAHVAVCRGCQWQQVAIGAQLEAKRASLTEALVRIGGLRREALPAIGAVPSPSGFRYRRRARFAVDASGRLGYAGRDGRPGLALRECHLLEEPIERLMLGLSDFFRPVRERPRHVEICAAGPALSILLEYGRRGAPPALAAEMLRRFRDLAGIVSAPDGAIYGQPDLAVGETWLRPDAFGQANQAVNQRLVAAALEGLGAGAGDRVLELFSGSGNFTLPLARRAAEVVAVEGEGTSLGILRRAIAAAGLDNVRIEAGAAARSVREMVARGERFDLVLLDPPRGGAREVGPDLVRLAPRRVAYVSCDPATLARDLRGLFEAGYGLEEATVFDQFPQTYHLEVLALLARAA